MGSKSKLKLVGRPKLIIGLISVGFILVFILVIFCFYSFGGRKDIAVGEGLKVNEATLTSPSKELLVEINEGDKTVADFLIENKGNKKAAVNFYKTNHQYPANNQAELVKRKRLAEGFFNYKMEKTKGNPSLESLRRANLATGVSWLAPAPLFTSIDSGQKFTLKLSLDAENLEPGDYKTNLLVLGTDNKEVLMVDVNFKVKPAAKIRFSSLEVIDGETRATSGNSDRVAGRGEKVLLNISLNNNGKKDAGALTLTLNSLDPLAQILGESTVEIKSAAVGGKIVASYLIQISIQYDSAVPPAMGLIIKDDQGKERKESFYLGEQGKFNYPTGLIPKTTNDEKGQGAKDFFRN